MPLSALLIAFLAAGLNPSGAGPSASTGAIAKGPTLVAGDVNRSSVVDAVDIQLVINGALELPTEFETDIDFDGNTAAVDIQLAINAALDISIDTDGDGLADAGEPRIGTNPNLPDTDGDAISDGQEVSDGTNPTVSEFATPPEPSTLTRKIVCGYQGWFMAPGDGNESSVGWRHWSRSTEDIGPGLYTVDMWPDVREYPADALFDAPNVTLQDGSTGKLFSSVAPGAVNLHFKWMKYYGIDGVFLQRFVSELGDPRFFDIRNKVLRNVRAGANTHGRVFALEYDTSGASASNLFTAITNDWKYLVDVEKILEDPRYLHHDGKPVITIWGLGFEGRGYTPAQAQQVIDFFKSDPDYGGNLVIGGVPTFWRTLNNDSESNPGWAAVYRSYDIIHPWMVGRIASQPDIDTFVNGVWSPDLSETQNLGIGYLPVIFPGFSWDNLMQLPPGTSLFPRRDGDFIYEQFNAWRNLGVTMIFVAMFDEVDESTAIFKVSANHPTTDNWVHYDGRPSDWYLRIVGEMSKKLRGEIPR
jgi:hypothetical protein